MSYQEGDIVKWKQRDRTIRKGYTKSAYKEELAKIDKLCNIKGDVIRLIKESIELEDKFYYKGYFETHNGVNAIVRITKISNRIYYILDNGRAIEGGQMKFACPNPFKNRKKYPKDLDN